MGILNELMGSDVPEADDTLAPNTQPPPQQPTDQVAQAQLDAERDRADALSAFQQYMAPSNDAGDLPDNGNTPAAAQGGAAVANQTNPAGNFPMKQIPGDDPGIPELQNPDGSTTPPRGPHPIANFTDNEILQGRAEPVSYSNACVDSAKKVINIGVKVNYQNPAPLNFSAKPVGDDLFNGYVDLANQGVAKYWSRTIPLSGEDWTVNVNAVNAKEGMPMTIANQVPWLGNFGTRSVNMYPYGGGTIYYDTRYADDSNGMFSETAAHEIGHGFLTNAFGTEWSWGHEGTSSMLGSANASAPPYPSEGEIGLMPYYSGKVDKYKDFLKRTLASVDDVKTLLYISGRNNK